MEPRTFGWALKQLSNGSRVMREGWVLMGRGQTLELQVPDQHSKMTQPYLFLNTGDGGRVPWVPAHADLLATDWSVA